MQTQISLLCGVPPMCDRCAEEDAKMHIVLPNYGERCLCESCIKLLIERGLVAADCDAEYVPLP